MFRKLPGVGPRQAVRFVLALLEKPEPELREFGSVVQNLKKDVSFCRLCFNISDNHLCSVCSDSRRDQSKMLVVEKVTDLDSIEKTGLYRGVYHVLGGAINPLGGLTPEILKFKELKNRLNKAIAGDKTVELIIATNPNAAGETTALFIVDLLKKESNISVTRLARGLSSGSNLEYIDEGTLKHALEHRR